MLLSSQNSNLTSRFEQEGTIGFLEIRVGKEEELGEIMRVYRAAKTYMDATGNETQWDIGYPSEQMVREDIINGKLYVLTAERTIHAAFYFSVEEDPMYKIIDGAWKSEDAYGVIHRVASDGNLRGVVRSCVAYCLGTVSNLRIDTHENNLTMQHALERCGFVRCGTVYLPNGEPRIAYQLC